MLNHMMVLGHRGWKSDYPENTILAFGKCLEIGAEGVEFDVQLTADGVPVVMHDARVDRTTDGSGRVTELNYEEIATFNAAHQSRFRFQPIPTLKDTLDTLQALRPDGCFNIELKVYEGDGQELVDQVLRVVQQHPLRQNILYSSFHHACLDYLQQVDHEARIGLLFEKNVGEVLARARKLGAYSVHLWDVYTDASLIQACHNQGLKVAVWTVDDEAAMATYVREQVDILISNRPHTALRVRKEVEKEISRNVI